MNHSITASSEVVITYKADMHTYLWAEAAAVLGVAAVEDAVAAAVEASCCSPSAEEMSWTAAVSPV